MEALNKQDLKTTTSETDSEITEIRNYWAFDACDGDSKQVVNVRPKKIVLGDKKR